MKKKFSPYFIILLVLSVFSLFTATSVITGCTGGTWADPSPSPTATVIPSPSPSPDPEAPVVESLEPQQAYVGDTIAINGSNFGDTRAEKGNVKFGDVEVVEYVSWSKTKIEVKVPNYCKTDPVTVTANGKISNSDKVFTRLHRWTGQQRLDVGDGGAVDTLRIINDPFFNAMATYIQDIDGTYTLFLNRYIAEKSKSKNWIPPASFGNGTNNDVGFCSTAFDSQGNAFLAFSQCDDNFVRVYVTRYDKEAGSWSNLEIINGDDETDTIIISVVADNNGNAYACMIEEAVCRNGESIMIIVARYDAALGQWGAPSVLNPPGKDVMAFFGLPSMDIDSQGNLFVLYSAGDMVGKKSLVTDRTRKIAVDKKKIPAGSTYYNVYQAASAQWSPAIQLNTGVALATFPKVLFDPQGSPVCLYSAVDFFIDRGKDADEARLYIKYYDPETQGWKAGVRVDGGKMSDPFAFVDMTGFIIDGKGNIMVYFLSEDADEKIRLFYNYYNHETDEWMEEVKAVDAETENDTMEAKMVFNSEGKVIAVFAQQYEGEDRIFSSVYDNNTDTWSTPGIIDGGGGSDYNCISLSIDPSDDAFAIFAGTAGGITRVYTNHTD